MYISTSAVVLIEIRLFEEGIMTTNIDGEYKIYTGPHKFDIGFPLVIITLVPTKPPLNTRISERFLIFVNSKSKASKSKAFRHTYNVPESIISSDAIYVEQLNLCNVWLDEILGEYLIQHSFPSIYHNWGNLDEVEPSFFLSLILSKRIDSAFLNNIQSYSLCYPLVEYITSFYNRRFIIKTEELNFN